MYGLEHCTVVTLELSDMREGNKYKNMRCAAIERCSNMVGGLDYQRRG